MENVAILLVRVYFELNEFDQAKNFLLGLGKIGQVPG